MARGTKLALSAALFFAILSYGALSFSKTSSSATLPAIDPEVVAPAEKLGLAFEAVSRHVKPAVVSVFSEKVVKFRSSDAPFPFGDDFLRQFFGNDFRGTLPAPNRKPPREFSVPLEGMGSGVILDKKGVVLTNYHVVKGFDEIKIQLPDGSEYPAKVKGYDARSDVAVIEVKSRPSEEWPTVTLGDSEKMKVGDLVLAIGAPFGLPQTVTQGIVSATGRANVGITDIEDFLQTDTAINPGNSGGPLVNMRGEVIGINSAIASGVGQFSGVGFSIPSNMVKAMLPQLLKGESFARGQLGIGIQDLSSALAKQFRLEGLRGVLVANVEANSTAEKAGIKVGDVIKEYAGKEILNSGQLRNLVAGTAPGTRVEIKAIRGGKELTLTATVGKLSAETVKENGEAEAASIENLGLDVEALRPQKRGGEEAGVVVSAVKDGSPAAFAGIMPDDIILEVNHEKIHGMKDFERAMEKAAKRDSVLFLIKRQNTSIFVVIQAR